MKKMWITMTITGAVVAGILALTPAFATSTTSTTSTPKEKEHTTTFKVVTVPAEQHQKKEVVERLYKSWGNGISKIEESYGEEFKKDDWDLIYGVDIDKHFTNQLSDVEEQSFFMALNEAKKAYKTGDSQYGILLRKDHKAARVVWERSNGNFHIADIVLKTKSTIWNTDEHIWTLADQAELH
ncbi:hypothetical protein [Paenibacillus qinlingensis]|uniref:Uncharacterized protein n=1 Tax=Paenibacillus qinlingensis TaxID=1837343 RepID=A0ABU1NTG9_9BACL|nr:hypothetical protein [Paenibacillus qinlingensis]MDR6550780.1 hypothetical protein [Paenibacillus qinlingensis]